MTNNILTPLQVDINKRATVMNNIGQEMLSYIEGMELTDAGALNSLQGFINAAKSLQVVIKAGEEKITDAVMELNGGEEVTTLGVYNYKVGFAKSARLPDSEKLDEVAKKFDIPQDALYGKKPLNKEKLQKAFSHYGVDQLVEECYIGGDIKLVKGKPQPRIALV